MTDSGLSDVGVTSLDQENFLPQKPVHLSRTSSRLPLGNVTNLKRQTLTSSVSISDASSPMQGTLQSSHFVTLDTQEYNSVQVKNFSAVPPHHQSHFAAVTPRQNYGQAFMTSTPKNVTSLPMAVSMTPIVPLTPRMCRSTEEDLSLSLNSLIGRSQHQSNQSTTCELQPHKPNDHDQNARKQGIHHRKLFETMSSSTMVDHQCYTKVAQPPKKVQRKPAHIVNVSQPIEKLTSMFTDQQDVQLTTVQRLSLVNVASTGSSVGFIRSILRIPSLKEGVMKSLTESIGERPQAMKNRKHGFVSVLMKKDFNDLRKFSWTEVISEMQAMFPELLQLLLSIMVPQNKRGDVATMKEITPQLGIVYAILMKSRNHELSRVQNIISMCLANNISDQKVYDRLNHLGVCLSYSRTLATTDKVGAHVDELLVEALKAGKYIRFIGDNLNFAVDVHEERLGKHKHLVHMFACAALVTDYWFKDKPDQPEIPIEDIKVDDILLNSDEYCTIRKDCVQIVGLILGEFMEQLSFVRKVLPPNLAQPESHKFAKKTQVLPIATIPFNEQYYDDDVKILLYFQNKLKSAYQKAGMELAPTTKWQVGGDLLTRERFSTTIHTRLRNCFDDERISHLGPVTMEFLHLMMNVLTKLVYGQLYEEDSLVEPGTMRHAKEKIHRKSVDPKDLKSYEANKDFFLSFFKTNLVEAAMDFFGMEDCQATPTKNVPPKFLSKAEQTTWVYEVLGRLVDQYIFPHWSKNNHDVRLVSREVTSRPLQLTLANGKVAQLFRHVREEVHGPPPADGKKNYAHLVLETVMIFKYMLDLIKCPDRDRFLGAVKMLLPMMKANNSQAKYPLDLLRLLVQQKSLLPLNEACQVFHACFVNTKGKVDSHVPADHQMEWLVKMNKQHIKHMFSNKKETTIEKKSAAIPGVADIAGNFDKESSVVIRAKKHSEKSVHNDELTMLRELRLVKPFAYTPGRTYSTFQKVQPSMLCHLNAGKFKQWFVKKKCTFTP